MRPFLHVRARKLYDFAHIWYRRPQWASKKNFECLTIAPFLHVFAHNWYEMRPYLYIVARKLYDFAHNVYDWPYNVRCFDVAWGLNPSVT